jgi:RHS repeat-associated protein
VLGGAWLRRGRRFAVGLAVSAFYFCLAAPAWATAPSNQSPPWVPGVFANGQELTVSSGDWLGTQPLTFSYQWQRCDSVKSAVLADSPVAYWRLGEAFGSATAADASGSSNAGTYTNAPTLGAGGGLSGDLDTAVRFDGVGSFVDVPDATSLKPASAFSLEAWVKTTASNGVIVDKPYTAGSQVSYSLSVASGKAQVKAQLTGGTYTAVSTSSVNDGQWHHLVGTFASSSLKIYVDGSLQATTTTSGSLQYSTQKLQIGRFDATGGTYLNGTLDEVAVYSTALSSTRVTAHHDAGSVLTGSGCSNISGATASFYALGSSDVGKRVGATVTATNGDGSASASSYATMVLAAAPVNISAPLVEGTPAVQGQALTADPGGWSGTATITYGYQWQRCSAYPSAVSLDGAAAYYRLGERTGTTAADTATGLSGSYIASPGLGLSGALGSDPDSAVLFDGATQYVQIPSAPGFGSGDFTIEGWFKTTASGTKDIWNSGNGTGEVKLYLTAGKVAGYASDGTNSITPTTTTTYNDGAWHYAVFTRSGSNFNLYVDNGTPAPGTKSMGSVGGAGGTTASIGASRPGSNEFFNGMLDEVAVYKSALSSTQVSTHWGDRTAPCTNIGGAASSTYTPVVADAGLSDLVMVTATNSAGSMSASSLPVPVAPATAPVNTSPPTISGSPVVGQMLTAGAGSWNGGASYSYQWQRCTAYPAAVKADSPLGWWRLGDRGVTTTATDSIGFNDGIYGDAPLIGVPGALANDGDTSVSLDKNSAQYVQLGHTIQFDSGNFTIEGWFKTTDYSFDLWRSGGTAGRYVEISLSSTGHVTAQAADPTTTSTISSTGTFNDGAWHYFAYTRSGNTFTLYVDPVSGANAGTDTHSVGDVDSANALPVFGANDSLTGQFGTVFLDEYAAYTGALGVLSSTRIQAHRDAGNAPCTDIATATNQTYTLVSADNGTSVTVKVTDTNSVGATSALATALPVSTSGSPVNTTIPAVTGTAQVGSTLTTSTGSWLNSPTSYGYQWQRCQGYAQAVVADGASGFWRLDEAADGTNLNAADSVGTNTGTYTNAPTFGIGGAIKTDTDTAVTTNSSQYIPLTSNVQFDTGPFAIEAWFKTKDQSANTLYIWQSGSAVNLSITTGIVNGFGLTSGLKYNDDTWHQVVVTRNGANVSLYIDGAQVNSTTTGSTGDIDSGTAPPTIGARQDAAKNFIGSLDEVAYYRSALTATQVQNHYRPDNLNCTAISGGSGATYAPTATGTPNDVGARLRVQVTATNASGNTSAISKQTNTVPRGAPTLSTPADGAPMPLTQPVLSVNNTVTGATHYAFVIAKDAAFSQIVSSSGWIAVPGGTPPPTIDWTVSTALTEGKTYYWRAEARNTSGTFWTTGWSLSRTLSIQSKRYGTRDSWAMWKAGPLAVNETTGNLVLSLPGPSYPTAVGDMGVSLAYNSLNTTDNGLGAGWTLAAGDSSVPPVKLIDHTLLSGEDQFAAAEIVWPDGGSSFYGQIGYATYQSPLGDPSRLEPDKDGHGFPTGNGWTLYASDGSFYRFGQADQTTGVALLAKADVLYAKPGIAGLTYAYTGTKLTQVTDGADTSRVITLTWHSISPGSCTDAIVCITGPDSVAWKYKGPATTPTATPLTKINDGTRDLAAFTYDANNRLQNDQNANDLDPTHASPGYNSTHAVTFAYTSSKLTSISEGPITGQTPSTSITSFSYLSVPVSTDAAANSHAQDPTLRGDLTRPAVGYTTVKAPCQQSGVSCGLPNSGATSRVYYDDFGHPLETVDPLGNTTQTGWNDHNQVLWSENPDGNPTDNTWDTVNNVLLFTQAPDPDGAGSMTRPVTSYRYDETKIGTACTPNDGTCGTETVFGGLEAAYYKNTDLSSRPDALQTDANVDFNWTTSGPQALGGRNDNFAVRWTGNIAIGTEGDYTFSVVSDGNTELAVGGVQASTDLFPYTAAAISDTTSHNTFAVSSQPLHLVAGLHSIALEYTELTGASEIHLRWSCLSCNPAISDQVIPMTALRPAWLNQTSTVTPMGGIAFRHLLDPASGNPDYTLAAVDGANMTTSFSYDSYGRVTGAVMPKGNANRTIDSFGNLQGSIDNRYLTTWSYYAAGETAPPPTACGGGPAIDQAQLLKSKSPYGIAATTTVFDSAGRLTATTNGKGTTCKTYSSEWRLLSDKAPGESQSTTYAYDPAGRRRTATDAGGTVTTEYDEAWRVKDSIDSFGAEETVAYDADSNVLQRTAAKGPLSSNTNYTTSYSYNKADQLTTLTDPASRQYSFYYCNCGRLQAVQYPDGAFSWSDYNPDGWTTAVYNRHGTLPAPLPSTVPADSQSSPLADYAYTYDQAGRKVQEVRSGGGLTTETTNYQYDSVGRLSQVTLPDGTARTYTYDLDSNRTSIVENGSTVASYGYDPTVTPGIDQLTSVITGSTTTFGYDTDGETTTRGSDTISWDGRGRHNGGTFGGTTVSYGFDATGFRRQRVAGSATTQYRLNGLFETDGSGTITLTSVVSPEGDLAHFAGPPATTSTVTYTYYNEHGDVGAEADQSGTRTAAYTYDPFGALRSGTVPGNAATERWVAAWNKKLDTTSSLIEMGARTYDPSLGRFLSVDPVDGGSCNSYDYVCQDPIDGYDLDGTLFGWARSAWHFVAKSVMHDLNVWRSQLTNFVERVQAISDRMNAWVKENWTLIKKLFAAHDCATALAAATVLGGRAIQQAKDPDSAAAAAAAAAGFMALAIGFCELEKALK